MTAEFDFPKFDPVSFASPQNANDGSRAVRR